MALEKPLRDVIASKRKGRSSPTMARSNAMPNERWTTVVITTDATGLAADMHDRTR
jgi:hypothetical protein